MRLTLLFLIKSTDLHAYVVVVVEIPHYELRLANVEVLRPFLAQIPKNHRNDWGLPLSVRHVWARFKPLEAVGRMKQSTRWTSNNILNGNPSNENLI